MIVTYTHDNNLTRNNWQKLHAYRQMLQADQKVTLPIISNSMQPTLHKEDCVLLKKCTKKELRRGDICAVYLVSGDILVHRFIGASKNFLFLKGDANSHFEKCSEFLLLARVESIIRDQKTIMPPPSTSFDSMKVIIHFFWQRLRFDITKYSHPKLIKWLKKLPQVASLELANNTLRINYFPFNDLFIMRIEAIIHHHFPTLHIRSYWQNENISNENLTDFINNLTPANCLKIYFKCKNIIYLLSKTPDTYTIDHVGHSYHPLAALREILLIPAGKGRIESITEICNDLDSLRCRPAQ